MVLNITWYVYFRVIPSVIYENLTTQTPSSYSHIMGIIMQYTQNTILFIKPEKSYTRKEN